MIWYEEEVARVEKEQNQLSYIPETLFYGSSSIRLWNSLSADFAAYRPVNLGFGGSTLAACVWFFERILKGYQPKRIVFYAGDNDLGDGRQPEEIVIFFQQLVALLNQHFPGIPFYFISIKPSPARWDIINRIQYTNQLIQAAIEKAGAHFHYINITDAMEDQAGKPLPHLFQEDGLHLSPAGYGVWKERVLNALSPNL